MNETAKEIISMLSILKENSYTGNFTRGRDFTIVADCKVESFRFVIDQAIAHIKHNQEGYVDTDSVKKKTNCYACRFCLFDAEGRSCQLGADKYSEACKLFEEA